MCVSFTWTIKTAPSLSSASRKRGLDYREFKNIVSSVVQQGRYDTIREGSYEHPCSSRIIHHSVEVDSGGVGSPVSVY